ncbi:MAG: hypothetical protein JNJ72_19800, partial [Anaerolineales bacterium]|nr:hypothetical protein [Anaerolineales bacterium]
YVLKTDINNFEEKTFWDKTFIGDKRAWADLIRLQIYGVMWSATGVDQIYSDDYEKAQTDFDENESYHDFVKPNLDKNFLALNVLETGFRIAGETPMILVNEPMLISSGNNSDIRYNFFYPRWAYDEYRKMMFALSEENNWMYVDLWDILPANEFTNSAIHLTPAGEKMLAEHLVQYVVESCE